MTMKPTRACPICACGSRKFERVAGGMVRVRCIECGKVSEV